MGLNANIIVYLYGVYNQNDDELQVLDVNGVWKYLQNTSVAFQNFNIQTDGKTVSCYEISAGANGKLAEMSLPEFFEGFSDEGIIIRSVLNSQQLRYFDN